MKKHLPDPSTSTGLKTSPDASPSPARRRVINFITASSTPPSLEQIPVQTDPDIHIRISEEPLPPSETDLYVVPAQKLAAFTAPGTGGVDRSSGTAVIGYGPAKMLGPAFEAGCRDYLKEPWDYRELKARAGRFLPRRELDFEWGRIEITPLALHRGSVEIALTPPEDRILDLLAANLNSTVRREALQYALWGELRPGSRSVDMHVAGLRKKFNLLAGKTLRPNPLHSIHGRGYSLIHNL